jgi:serine/threonine-protein kinase
VLYVGAREAPEEVEVRGDTLRMDRLVDSLTVAVLRELGRTRPVGAVRHSAVSATSLPALKAFLQGEQFYRRGLWDSALVQYDRALALDSTFALAYRRMSLVVGWNSAEAVRYRLSDEYVRRAAAYNHGLAPRDSLLIFTDSLMVLALEPGSGAYFENKRRLFSTLTEAQRQYPGDPEVWHAVGEGRFHSGSPVATQVEMLEAFDRAIALDSGFTPAYFHSPGLAVAIDYGDPQRARRYLAAYLRLNPRDDNSVPLRLTATLLDSSRRDLPGTARLIDTTPARVLWSVGVEHLSQWPDSAETAVRVLRSLVLGRHRSTAPPGVWNDSSALRRALASALTFRGHLREAYRTHSVFAASYPDRFLNPYVRLALLGAVPAETAAAAFQRSLEQDPVSGVSGHVLILPWFFARRDAAALGRFASLYDSLARRDSVPLAKALRQYGASAARAYATLVGGDSTVALRAFASLPDSMCEDALDGCRHEKLILGRLLRAAGEDRKAFELMERWTGLDPEVVLERARLAERLGERKMAIKSYRFVTEVWRHADPELQPFVQEARNGLARVMAESGAGGGR